MNNDKPLEQSLCCVKSRDLLNISRLITLKYYLAYLCRLKISSYQKKCIFHEGDKTQSKKWALEKFESWNTRRSKTIWKSCEKNIDALLKEIKMVVYIWKNAGNRVRKEENKLFMKN